MNADDHTDMLGSSLRRLVAEQVDIAPAATSWNDVATAGDRPAVLRGGRSRWTAVVAVATCVGVLVVGLALLNRRGSSDSADLNNVAAGTTVASSPVPLDVVASLGPNDWVTPTDPPPGVELLWAMGFDNKVLTLGTDATRPEYTISIVLPSDPEARTPFPLEVDGGWVETVLPNEWRVRRAIGQAIVAVQGPGPYDEAAASFLDGLVVVPSEGLPIRPLDPNGPMTTVASYMFDGLEYRYEVVESNGFMCSRVSADEGISGGCGPLGEVGEAFASTHGGGGYSSTQGSDVIRVTDAGVVRGDVVTVEVVFVDGSVARVSTEESPTVLPERRFWVVAADVTIEGLRSYSAVIPVAEIRAFDASGELVDVLERGPLNGGVVPQE